MKLFGSMNFGMALPAAMDSAIAEGVIKNVEELDSLVAKTKERIGDVVNSRKLTNEGRRDELARIADELDQQLTKLEAQRTTGYSALINSARKQLEPAAKKPLTPDEAARAVEIRAHCRSMDSPTLTAFFIEALAKGNDEIVGAIESDPLKLLRLADSPSIERLRHERAAATNPEAAARHRDFSLALTEVKSALRHARSTLKAEGIVFKSQDPLAA